MKRILTAFLAITCLFGVSAALADSDAENIYKSTCQGCHGADGSRAPASGVEPIKGQSQAEILRKLEGYKDGTFGGANKQIMHNVVKNLDDSQLKDLADHGSKL